jgi:hypothetical protein
MIDVANKYVVYWETHLKDELVQSTKLVTGEKEALAWVNKVKNGFDGDNTEVWVFRLGENVRLTAWAGEEPQPAKKTVVYGLATQGGHK